jgi:hypothetical protein
MTAPADRWIRAHDWARIVSLVGLPSGAVPADVIAALERRGAAKAAAHTEREVRMAAIRTCRRCDPAGWLLGPDRTPVEPATRCDHGAATAPPAGRDITEPIHEPPSERTS